MNNLYYFFPTQFHNVLELRLTPDKLIDSVPYKDEECNSSNKDVDLSISTSKDKPKQ